MLACRTFAAVWPLAVTEMKGAAAAVAATPCRNRRLEMLVITTKFTTNSPRTLRVAAEDGAGRLYKSVRAPLKSYKDVRNEDRPGRPATNYWPD